MKKENTAWMAAGGFLAGAALAYILWKNNKTAQHEKPPKGAPQLKLENPGSQHDFPKPPMESEVG